MCRADPDDRGNHAREAFAYPSKIRNGSPATTAVAAAAVPFITCWWQLSWRPNRRLAPSSRGSVHVDLRSCEGNIACAPAPHGQTEVGGREWTG